MQKTLPPDFSNLTSIEVPFGASYANFSLFFTKESNHLPLNRFAVDSAQPCLFENELNAINKPYPAEKQLYGCSFSRI